jgi:tRNA threonylcarbamoyladenosine biosynthesis protein TsaB
VPVVPVSDLQALAQQALAAAPAVARVMVCSDARMQEVYWGCFERGPQGLAVAQGQEQVGRPEAVQRPEAWAAAPAVTAGAGSGFSVYPALCGTLGEIPGPVFAELLPRAQEVAQLARGEVQAGRVLPPEMAVPVYLRDQVTQPPGQSSN